MMPTQFRDLSFSIWTPIVGKLMERCNQRSSFTIFHLLRRKIGNPFLTWLLSLFGNILTVTQSDLTYTTWKIRKMARWKLTLVSKLFSNWRNSNGKQSSTIRALEWGPKFLKLQTLNTKSNLLGAKQKYSEKIYQRRTSWRSLLSLTFLHWSPLALKKILKSKTI